MSTNELALLMAKKEHEQQFNRAPKGMMQTWDELPQGKKDWWVKSMLPFAEVSFEYFKASKP